MDETPPTGFGRVKAWWSRNSVKLKEHFAEYGRIAIITYFTIFFATVAGFAIAIGGSGEGAWAWGTLGAAWLATKATQPLRIGATLAVTPVVAAVWHRLRGRTPPVAPPITEAGEPPARTPD